MKTIIITGCNGFIGYHTVIRFLNLGYSVIGVDPEGSLAAQSARAESLGRFGNFQFVNNIEGVFDTEHVTGIIHLGAKANVLQSMVQPNRYMSENVGGLLDVLNFAHLYRLPVVFASSSSIYGKHPGTGENPCSVYGVSKLAGEHLCRVYCEQYGLDITALRFFTVYGPWGRPDMATMRFIYTLIETETVLKLRGDGNLTRDFTYVDDVVEAIRLSMEEPKGNGFIQYDIGKGTSETVRDLFEHIRVAVRAGGGRAVTTPIGDVKAEAYQTRANTGPFKRAYNWAPETSLEAGISATVAWCGTWPDEFLKLNS